MLIKRFFLLWVGLGVVPGERSFLHENKWNDQERVLKNIGTICKGTERNGTEIALKECLKSGTCSYYQERVLSRERILNQECVLNHLEIIKRFF